MQWQRINIYRSKLPIGIKGVTGGNIKEHFEKASSQKDAKNITELVKELQNKNEIIKELQREIKDYQNRVTTLKEQLEKIKK